MISATEILIRLAIAALAGSLIGFERERTLWAAGIRTHMLVAVGACLIMIVSAYGFENALKMDHVVLDPSRIAAQVVSGIGFLGAGSILLRGQVIRGLTTAASIWAVAAIGLACGGGLFFAGGAATALILMILVGVKPLEEAYRARVQSCTLEIKSEKDSFTIDDLKSLLGVRGGQIKRLFVSPTEEDLVNTSVALTHVSQQDIRNGIRRLSQAPGVHSVELKKNKSMAAAERDRGGEA